ncbi:FAD-dependent monooxygenase [Sinorhizobium medicae]|uniref:FAD-dependent monooxygenase n=1 Tax=Sinorhizobium medicae TaxID=110321 RepID=UPI001AAEFDB7|nr:FAD-dependent monooxygenase [Sinorhizobium medicae]MBO1965484.1 FAD-dependent monooxygenase [Sinorhizobium medicae]WQO57062.1 FAD-dependent monooxygenase [Sinorhizobium medicae]WQP41065.1 FAD-dependent monooxygenase [Sinorhizobium medicae]
MTHREYDTDVLVVGTGPMGATTALALAKYGIRVHAISRWNWLANTPRAHITNQRTVEVLRSLGIEEELRQQATPWELMGDTLFTTSFAGPEIARLQTWGTGDLRFGDYIEASPCPMLDVPQPVMEPILVNAAARSGAQMSFNTEYLSHVQDADGVTVTLRNLISGQDYEQRVRFLVGADGARSQVAVDIDLPFDGVLARAGTVYTQFKADLSKYVAHRPSILHWIVNPEAGFGEIGMGLLRAVKPWTEWIAGWGFDMSKGDPDTSRENALKKIRLLVGDPDLECEILSISPWYVNQQYALEYSRGRVFCGGDAVHRHPPSSGLGLNTSVQDGFNLAWKLAYVVKGYATLHHLGSYGEERSPVGRQIVGRANQSRVDYAPLRTAFYGQPSGFSGTLEHFLGRFFAADEQGLESRRKMLEALDLKNYEFNAQGTEMNQRYVSRGVAAEDGSETWLRDEQLFHQATTRPGAKIPHAWLVGLDGKRVSTLDLVGDGMFTLVTGIAGQAWEDAVAELALPFLRCVRVGAGKYSDPYFYWARIREIDEGGAVLVRPDGIIAWRQKEAVSGQQDVAALLSKVLDAVLGRSSADVSGVATGAAA